MNFKDIKIGDKVVEIRNVYHVGEVLTVVDKDKRDCTVLCKTEKGVGYWKVGRNIRLVSVADKKPKIKHQPNILIIGYGNCAKDTAAEYWRDHFGMTFQSSSWAAGEIFIFDLLMKKYDYASKEECFADRRNRRYEWYDLICWYNKDDKTRLAREILSKTGAYIGMRDRPEVLECKEQNVFDIIIWIDAEERVGKESEDSCTVTKEDAHIIITNNGTEAEFKEKLNAVGKIIFKKLV